MYVYVCMYACMHICMYAYMHVCMYVSIYMCVYIYICTLTDIERLRAPWQA